MTSNFNSSAFHLVVKVAALLHRQAKISSSSTAVFHFNTRNILEGLVQLIFENYAIFNQNLNFETDKISIALHTI